MELYITRHGQTKANIEQYMQGQTPGELTSEGIEQAQNFGNYYKDMKFDEIYCSDILRAKKTLEIIINQSNHKEHNNNIITYSEKLREINVKSLEYKPCSLELKLRNNPPERFRFNLTEKNDETFIDVFYRISLFLDFLIQKNISKNYISGINKENVYKLNEEAKFISSNDFLKLWEEGKLSYNDNNLKLKKILILCHGGVIYEMINNILYRSRKNVIVKRIKSENTGLYVVKIFPKEKEENVKKDNDIVFSFNLVNDISHLKNSLEKNV
jgi:broad specificity phosphatase PhoE